MELRQNLSRGQRYASLLGVPIVNQSDRVAASVRQRLKNLAARQGEEFQALLTRYAGERLLYRLTQSKYREQFILKGAFLFSIWSDEPHRPTRDLDLLGRGDNTLSYLEKVFQEICQVEVLDDGLEFNSYTVRSQRIKEDNEYEGVRINLRSNLTGTRTRIELQVDIGFGDAVTPAAINREIPTLLSFPAPLLSTYPKETVIAEKFQALVFLGMANSRMKDFYDLWFLSQKFEFEGKILSLAIKETFKRRRTPLPLFNPLALSKDFSEDGSKVAQWKAFLRKSKLLKSEISLSQVITNLENFLMPPVRALVQGETFKKKWFPAGRWHEE
jgi:predicted nucleotidyltransferase component of viral defense system